MTLIATLTASQQSTTQHQSTDQQPSAGMAIASEYLLPAAYLPHAAPMLLLERVLAVTAQQVCCEVSVTGDGVLAPFLTAAGTLPGWYAIELMAQTVGIWSGWHRQQRGEPHIALGMLLGARELTCSQGDFPAGATLTIEMNLLMQDEHFASFEGRILHQQQVLATGRINTYQPDPQALQQLFARDTGPHTTPHLAQETP